ncbi:MAG: AAA family ATPase, partial [Pseudomonadota bacterium]
HEAFMRLIYSDWDQAYAETLSRRFDLRRDQTVKTLSHGQRVKAGLLMALARRPRLVILDEPTNGLDPVARAEVLNELIDVVRDDDRAVLFSSHNTQDIEQLSDQITFIDRGQVIGAEDKDAYLDRWRRLRLEAADDGFQPAAAGLHQVQREGRLVTLTVSQFDEQLPEQIAGQGARVLGVERLSLEEIFVAEVMRHRDDHGQGAAA